MNIHKQLEDSHKIAIDLNIIGSLFEEMKRYQESLDYYQRAYDINEKLAAKDRMKVDLQNIIRVANILNKKELVQSSQEILKSLE